MVTRDDLPDGGAAHVVATIDALRASVPHARVEVLVSDFGGDEDSVDLVIAARPDVFNHNVETVPRLYREVRPQADYAALAARARSCARDACRDADEIGSDGRPRRDGRARSPRCCADLRSVGVDIVTIGQYLRPGPGHLPVSEFVEPARFDEYAALARRIGFAGVASAPFVRSSYHAAEMASQAASQRSR